MNFETDPINIHNVNIQGCQVSKWEIKKKQIKNPHTERKTWHFVNLYRDA